VGDLVAPPAGPGGARGVAGSHIHHRTGPHV